MTAMKKIKNKLLNPINQLNQNVQIKLVQDKKNHPQIFKWKKKKKKLNNNMENLNLEENNFNEADFDVDNRFVAFM